MKKLINWFILTGFPILVSLIFRVLGMPNYSILQQINVINPVTVAEPITTITATNISHFSELTVENYTYIQNNRRFVAIPSTGTTPMYVYMGAMWSVVTNHEISDITKIS